MQKKIKNMIGIVGGLGPSAGLDLAQKVVEQTISSCDQEHLPTMLVSIPEVVGNRTEFILGRHSVNPAGGIIYALDKLRLAGATVIGIPCNTSHAGGILEKVCEYLDRQMVPVTLVNMVDEVCRHIECHHPSIEKVGVLSTTGTAVAGVYRDALLKIGREIVELEPDFQKDLNEAIHDETFGIKARSRPVSRRAVSILRSCIECLVKRGAQAGVLACTELPLAMRDIHDCGLPLMDSNLILARALVRAAAPEKLKPWPVAPTADPGALSMPGIAPDGNGVPALQERFEEVEP